MNRSNPYEDEFVLLRNFNEGDNAAFKAIYDTHYRPMLHFANRYVKDLEQAEDILTECFVILWQKREEFKTFKGLTSFLYTIIRNSCLNHLRKVKTRTNSIDQLSYLHKNNEKLQEVEKIKTDLIQYSLIEGSKLPSEMKKVFQLIYMDGFSLAEAADKLNLSIHTVRVQKANAVRRVRENLTRKGLLNWFI